MCASVPPGAASAPVALAAALLLAALAAPPPARAQASGDEAGRERPSGARRVPDWRVDDRVFARLAESASLAAAEIAVQVDESVVTLTGRVASEDDRRRAEELARRVRGVREVVNELEVAGEALAPVAEVGDEALAERVATALAEEAFTFADASQEWLFGWEIEGHNWEFDVEADDGIVTLEGTVGAFSDVRSAVATAKGVEGVRAVRHELVPNYDPYGFGYNRLGGTQPVY